MEFDDIRNAFSKASIVLDKGDIAVVYSRSNSNDWFSITESSGNGLNTVFAELIDGCKNLVVSVSKDYASMRFAMPYQDGNGFMLFPPMKRVLTQRELDDIVDGFLSSPLSADQKEFIDKQSEFLNDRADGIDLDDKYQVGELTDDYLKFLRSLMPDRKDFSIPTMQRFSSMKRLASAFQSITSPWEVEVVEPEIEKAVDRSGFVFDGCIDLFLSADDLGLESYRSVISGESKDCFLSLVRSCDVVGIEVSFRANSITFNLLP